MIVFWYLLFCFVCFYVFTSCMEVDAQLWAPWDEWREEMTVFYIICYGVCCLVPVINFALLLTAVIIWISEQDGPHSRLVRFMKWRPFAKRR